MGRIAWFRSHRYRLPEIVRGEDQDLLLRSYDSSRFACLPEVLMGYRQSGLPLRKVLESRRNLARVQWSVNLDKGRPGHAVLGVLTCFLKSVADTVLAAAGAQRTFVTRQARGAPPKEIDRWRTVWEELQQSSSDNAASHRSPRAAS
jgi:hypothetical protein